MKTRWDEIKELFHEAVARPPDARALYLDEACAGDAGLRAEVERLLASHEAAGSFLDTPPAVQADESTRSPQLEGHRIGPYQLHSRLGAGGMGEVYRARDVKLGRDVAIKILPHLLTRDPERLARFEREARVLASLNHPNIGAIYGVEDPAPGSGPVASRALVLELVEGDTLAERIARGTRDSGIGSRDTTQSGVAAVKSRRGIPIVEALKIAEQIAGALEAAHHTGIIHRDLKPPNIKITPAGVVKVLDFGLAKAAISDARSSADLAHSPTMTMGGTQHGVILGTAAYMSPEQARGHVVDKRTDIWAFGCVLYEMLAGRLAFPGTTVSDTIVSILEREPDWTALPRATPAKVRDLLRRCLQKDASRRLHDVADARIEIEDVRSAGTHSSVRARAWAFVGVMTAVALGLAAFLWLGSDRQSLPNSSEWVQVTNFPDSAVQPALSPDGRLLTFVRGPGTFTTQGQIYVKQLPNGEPVPLTQDDLVKMSPVFSPDGTRIAYTVTGADGWNTWSVDTLRGTPRRWLHNASGLVWADAGQLLFSEIKSGTLQHMGLVKSTEARDAPRDVYFPAHQNAMAHRSSLSPDGRWVLLVEMDERSVWLPCRLVPFGGGLAGRTVGPPAARCTDVAWAPDGAVMYFSADTGDGFHLWRQRFPSGQPEQITRGPTAEEGVAIAPDGHSAITSVGLRRRGIWIHDSSGERQLSGEGYAFWPMLSRDRKRICYRVSSNVATGQSPTELWMAELDSGRTERILPGQLVTQYDLSADDRIVAAVAGAGGKNQLWLAWLDGREPPRPIPGVEGDNPRFGAGGDIFFRAAEGDSMYLFRTDTNGATGRKVSSEKMSSVFGGTSPDGEWLSGMVTSYGMSAVSTTGRVPPVPVLASSTPSSRLRWSPDGRRVYLSIAAGSASAFGLGRTYVLPLTEGSMLPRIPAGGFRSEADIAAMPGVESLPYADVFLSATSGTYAFSRETVTRNLFRIPLR